MQTIRRVDSTGVGPASIPPRWLVPGNPVATRIGGSGRPINPVAGET